MNPPASRPDGSTWNEYAQLVLHQLEAHNDGIAEVGQKLDEYLRVQQLEAQTNENFRKDIAKSQERYERTLYHEDKGLVTRVSRIEQGDVVETAIKKYRKWLVTIILTVMFSVLIPLINFIRTFMG